MAARPLHALVARARQRGVSASIGALVAVGVAVSAGTLALGAVAGGATDGSAHMGGCIEAIGTTPCPDREGASAPASRDGVAGEPAPDTRGQPQQGRIQLASAKGVADGLLQAACLLCQLVLSPAPDITTVDRLNAPIVKQIAPTGGNGRKK